MHKFGNICTSALVRTWCTRIVFSFHTHAKRLKNYYLFFPFTKLQQLKSVVCYLNELETEMNDDGVVFFPASSITFQYVFTKYAYICLKMSNASNFGLFACQLLDLITHSQCACVCVSAPFIITMFKLLRIFANGTLHNFAFSDIYSTAGI